MADVRQTRAFLAASVPASMDARWYELSDERGPHGVLQGAQGRGTGANILAGIAWMLAGVLAGDSLYLHYSGHGVLSARGDAGELLGRNSLWVPLDYRSFRGGGERGCISDDELRRQLVEQVPAGAKLWVTSDSCHSGSMLDLRYSVKDASGRGTAFGAPGVWQPDPLPSGAAAAPYNPANRQPATLLTENKFYPPTAGSVILLSGCRDSQTAADAVLDNQPTGALTWSFLQCLRANRSAPVKYFLKDVRALLVDNGFDQQPQVSSGGPVDVRTSVMTLLGLG